MNNGAINDVTKKRSVGKPHHPSRMTMKLLLTTPFLLISSLTLTYGFVSPTIPQHTRIYSEPSDTSSDADYVLVESEDYVPSTPEETAMSSVMDMLPNTISSEVDSAKRSQINDALYLLEATKIDEPASSPLLNGVWELRYVGGYASEWALPSPTRQLALFLYSGGYSPGVFALRLAQQLPISVGDLEIAISRDQPRVQATCKVGNDQEIQVQARLDVVSSLRLSETYQKITVLGREIEIPALLQYSRELYVTYVDEDLLIVRDGSGVPEVLVRKNKQFTQNWGMEPEAMEDMNAP